MSFLGVFLTSRSQSSEMSLIVPSIEATPIMKGMSWPVLLITYAPSILFSTIVFSMNTIKQMMIAPINICMIPQYTTDACLRFSVSVSETPCNWQAKSSKYQLTCRLGTIFRDQDGASLHDHWRRWGPGALDRCPARYRPPAPRWLYFRGPSHPAPARQPGH